MATLTTYGEAKERLSDAIRELVISIHDKPYEGEFEEEIQAVTESVYKMIEVMITQALRND